MLRWGVVVAVLLSALEVRAGDVGAIGGPCFPNGTCHKGARCEGNECRANEPAAKAAPAKDAPAATSGPQYLPGDPAPGAKPNVTGKLGYLATLDTQARKVADDGLAKGTLRVCASDVNAAERGQERVSKAVDDALRIKDHTLRAAKIKEARKLGSEVYRCVTPVKKGGDVTFAMSLPPGDYEFFSEIPGTDHRGVMDDGESGEVYTLTDEKPLVINIHSTPLE